MRKPSSGVLQYLLLCASVFVFLGGIFVKVFETELVDALSSVSLNGGGTTLADSIDLSSSVSGMGSDTGAYTWTSNAQTLMFLNIPGNSGTTIEDFSGDNNDGVVNGNGSGLYTSSGKVGGALNFDGSDDYIAIDSSTINFANATQGAVSAWVKSTCMNPFCPIFETDSNNSGEFRILLQLNNGYADFQLYNGSYFQVLSSNVVADNQWHHIVGTWNSSGMRIYVDGILRGSNATAVTIDNYTPARTTIGAIYYPPSPPDYHDFFSGSIDELQVWKRNLAADMVTRLYQDGVAGVGGPTLIDHTYTSVGDVWNLSVVPITSSGSVGTAVPSGNTVTIQSDGTNLCTAGGQASDLRLDAGETSFDNTAVTVVNCTFTIDGAHTFSRLTVGDGAGTNDSVLVHSETTTSTVYSINITSSSDIVINTDGLVNTDGRGFLGGNRSSNSSDLGRTSGNVTANGSASNGIGGNGGSYGGRGGFTGSGSWGSAYGDVTNPTEPGAGGGARDFANQGCDGGGLVRFTASGSLAVRGTISARGEQSCPTIGGGGAGGGVYLNSASFSGSGTIRANGGNGGCNCGYQSGGGGGGRVAILYTSSSFSGSTQAYGGTWSTDSSAGNGGAGTIYMKASGDSTGDLIIDNNGNAPYADSSPLTTTPSAYQDVVIRNQARALINQTNAASDISMDSLSITSSSSLVSEETDASTIYKLDLTLGSLTIDTTSSISSDGRGFLGGNRFVGSNDTGKTSGNVTTNGSAGGDGAGSGGSHGGLGGIGISSASGLTYDSLTNPTEAGGGGGARDAPNRGGDGGGIILLDVSGTMTLSGTISSDGTSTTTVGGGGAGGTVNITAGTITGNGTIRANGSQGGVGGFSPGGGGGGRVALRYTTNNFTGTVQAIGGLLLGGGANGGAGTVYLKSSAQTYGDLIVKNNDRVPAEASTPLPATPTTLDSVTISDDARVSSGTLSQVIGNFSLDDGWYTQSNPSTVLEATAFSMVNGSNLTHSFTDLSTVHKVNLDVSTLSIDPTSTINVDGRGYLGAFRNGNGATGRTTGNGTVGGSSDNAGGGGNGGSYGGLGGQSGGTLGVAYGDLANPTEPGAGGGGRSSGSHAAGNGGGYVHLLVSGTATVNGTISAAGGEPTTIWAGGGAGGGIYLDTGILAGNGTFSVIGGNGGTQLVANGSGGGGRAAIFYDSSTFSGTYSTYGGTAVGGGQRGASGTVYLKDNDLTYGDLIVNDNNFTTAAYTPLFVSNVPTTSYTFRNLSVINLAELVVDTPCSGTALTVAGTIDLSGTGIITNNQSGTCTVSIAPVNILTTSLPSALNGAAYSQTLEGSGYAPLTWSVVSGSLPSGLSLNPSTGVISGTPTVNGTSNFTIEVSDSNPGGAQTDQQALSITVSDAPTAPDAITNLSATSGNSQVSLTWSAPANNGSAITDYVVQYGETSGFPGNAATFNDGTSASTGATVTGLVNGTEYSFRVAAVNGVGQGAYSNVDTAIPAIPAAPTEADSEINIDVNDFLSFEIENFASGDEPAGDQPFGAGAQITDLTSTGNNDYAISGDFGTPVFTRLQTTTNSTDGYNVIAYASNLDGRTQTLLRSGGTPGSSADEISDTITRLSSSQGANDTLTTSTDTGLAFRLHDANTSSILREADEDTQWGDNDTTNALWASFPLGSGAAQIIYDTATYSAPATTAYINWFVGISSTQRSGSYSGQVTFTASVN